MSSRSGAAQRRLCHVAASSGIWCRGPRQHPAQRASSLVRSRTYLAGLPAHSCPDGIRRPGGSTLPGASTARGVAARGSAVSGRGLPPRAPAAPRQQPRCTTTPCHALLPPCCSPAAATPPRTRMLLHQRALQQHTLVPHHRLVLNRHAAQQAALQGVAGSSRRVGGWVGFWARRRAAGGCIGSLQATAATPAACRRMASAGTPPVARLPDRDVAADDGGGGQASGHGAAGGRVNEAEWPRPSDAASAAATPAPAALSPQPSQQPAANPSKPSQQPAASSRVPRQPGAAASPRGGDDGSVLHVAEGAHLDAV